MIDYNRINILPDDVVVEICDKLDLDGLQNFMDSSARNYRLCNIIFERKLMEQRKRRRKLIINLLDRIGYDQVLDISNMNLDTGQGGQLINPNKGNIDGIYDHATKMYKVVDVSNMDESGFGAKIINRNSILN